MQRIKYFLVRTFLFFFYLLPFRLRLWIADQVASVFLLGRRSKVARVNLKIAFPEISEQEMQRIMQQSAKSFALMLIDTFRYKVFTPDWVKANVTIDDEELYHSNLAQNLPLLKLTAHYGSFDLCTATHAAYAEGGAIVVRELRNPYLSDYIRSLREQGGTKTVVREGGLRAMLKQMKTASGIGMLFDQNLTRKNAVFVDWFGKPAATTVGPAILSRKVDCKVQIELVVPQGNDKYLLKVRDCPIDDLKTLSSSDYIRKFTQRASDIVQQLILEEPEHWFWFHRRWKTRPEGEPEDVY